MVGIAVACCPFLCLQFLSSITIHSECVSLLQKWPQTMQHLNPFFALCFNTYQQPLDYVLLEICKSGCSLFLFYLTIIYYSTRTCWIWDDRYPTSASGIPITWNFRGSHISRHLNFAILRKFCILTHFNFAFLIETHFVSLSVLFNMSLNLIKLNQQCPNKWTVWGLYKRSATWSGDGKQ